MIGLQSLSRALHKEGFWLLIGMPFGYMTPVQNWFGINLKLLIVMAGAIGVLEIFTADWLLKRAFPKLSQHDYNSIVLIIRAVDTSQSTLSKIYGYAAAVLVGQVCFIGGFGCGQSLSIYLGR